MGGFPKTLKDKSKLAQNFIVDKEESFSHTHFFQTTTNSMPETSNKKRIT